MVKKTDKQALFEDYFHTLTEVMRTFETVFELEGVWSKVIGVDDTEKHHFSSHESEQAAKSHVRASSAWHSLSCLYDYSVEGIAGDLHPTDIVIGGAEVLSFITTENCSPSKEWERIVWQGDGRFALDDGEPLVLEKLAYLAGVDVRTVRNAISSGELSADKTDEGLRVDNASARKWLQGRRGFKPTVIFGEAIDSLDSISTPAAFGAFLTAQRARMGLDGGDKVVAFHPGLSAAALMEIEAGVFRLPIDTVFPLADFYQLDRKAFLACVMRVFFNEQLASLRESLLAK